MGPREPFKVATITVGPVEDCGFNSAHNQGRLYAQSRWGEAVFSELVENVPETSEVERVMERMIESGTRLFFATSFGHLDPTLRLAQKYPDVRFLHCGGHMTAKNVATYIAYIHEPLYVAGVVAGRATRAGRLGFVAAHPIPNVFWSINAFALGVRSVNPNAIVSVVWTNSWSDPLIEAESVMSLLSSGADVIALHLDSPVTVVQTAEKHGAYCVGFHTDVRDLAPHGWLTGAVWDWGEYYSSLIGAAIDGTLKSQSATLGLKSGCVRLAQFGKSVPNGVRREAEDVAARIVRGELSVFVGPMLDRDGLKRLDDGAKPSSDWLARMDWFIEGVEGQDSHGG